jgi:hypothetical protein
VPHEALDSLAYASHVPLAPPLQQPLGQIVPLQPQPALELVQPLFAGHAAHVAPPVPHWALVWLPQGTHVLPLQQPFEQLPELHEASGTLLDWIVVSTSAFDVRSPRPALAGEKKSAGVKGSSSSTAEGGCCGAIAPSIFSRLGGAGPAADSTVSASLGTGRWCPLPL